MMLLFPLLLVVIAGILNGSFALPTKHLTHWHFEHIWSVYALLAFLLLPLLFVHLYAPQTWVVYQQAPTSLLQVMCVGGFLFGVGQVGLALAIDMIGIGLSFVICISLGTCLGAILPLIVIHPESLFTPFGIFTQVGTLLIIVGVLLCYYAGILRDRARASFTHTAKRYGLGVLLAVMAGVFSAGQNFTFSYTVPLQHQALQLGMSQLASSVVLWPGFLICSVIPYLLYMGYLLQKNQSVKQFFTPHCCRHVGFALCMALCWYGSLMLYSKTSLLVGRLGPIIAWPLFMVFIILTSNFWGWFYGEWRDSGLHTKRYMMFGIFSLVLAVIVLAYSMSLL